MITKHIRHHLTEEGKVFFQSWLKQLKQGQEETSGFEGILIGNSEGESDVTHLILKFADAQGLKKGIVAVLLN